MTSSAGLNRQFKLLLKRSTAHALVLLFLSLLRERPLRKAALLPFTLPGIIINAAKIKARPAF